MKTKEYGKLTKRIADYSKIAAELDKSEAIIKERQLNAARTLLPRHSQLKAKQSEIEAEVRVMAEANYQDLFGADDKRTHQTPFGKMQFRKSEYVDFDDAEKLILKIKVLCTQEKELAAKENREPRFTLAQLVRTSEAPNIEALERLDDLTLALFGAQRKHEDNFKITPPTIKSDKPAKATEMKEAA